MMNTGCLNGREQLGLVLGMLLTFAATAAAGDTYWQHDPATPGDWFDPTNWNAGVPTASDGAFVDNGGTAEILSIQAASACVLYAGYSASGSVAQTNGAVTVSDDVYLGHNATGDGTYTMEGGQLECQDLHVGYEGTGQFTQTGGSIVVLGGSGSPTPDAAGTVIGSSSGSVGAYNLSGGELSGAVMYVGYEGSGAFTQTDGIVRLEGGWERSLYIGSRGAADGTYELSGGNLWVGNMAVVGGGVGWGWGVQADWRDSDGLCASDIRERSMRTKWW